MEKLVYYFIWKGRLVKLSREQIRGNESSGGLGVMDIQKKADALLLKSLLRALCGRLGTTIQQAFSYWLGLPLRRIIGTHWGTQHLLNRKKTWVHTEIHIINE